ncbi:MAG: DNA repair protein RadC [Nitrospinota bacterium]|nr:DNA repair protein RadC [Nitrospinota bacterium]
MKPRRYVLKEAIKQWPESDRPREKLKEKGPAFLSDSELLATIIGSGSGSKNALDLARALLLRFDSLAGIEAASLDELRSVAGIGFNKAANIRAALELGRRFAMTAGSAKSAPIRTAEDAFNLYRGSAKNLRKEVFSVMLLNSKHKLIKTVLVSEGALNAAYVEPREVFNPAIRESAFGVILTHNHPSGDPEPSDQDITLTRRLVEAGKLMGIQVIDHLVIGDNNYFSFSDNDLL